MGRTEWGGGGRADEMTYISSWCLFWGRQTWRRGGEGEEGVRANDVTYINFLLGVSALGKAHLEGEGRWGGRGESQ